jgi:AcrR family transcriptional regulator
MSIERSPRVRRSSEAARENILAACEAILLEKGPQALKLADVAAGAGVANATVLHHFGSVDGVQTALMARMIRQLVERIAVDFGQHQDAVGRVGAGARALFDAFGTKGGARLAAWLDPGRRVVGHDLGHAAPKVLSLVSTASAQVVLLHLDLFELLLGPLAF